MLNATYLSLNTLRSRLVLNNVKPNMVDDKVLGFASSAPTYKCCYGTTRETFHPCHFEPGFIGLEVCCCFVVAQKQISHFVRNDTN